MRIEIKVFYRDSYNFKDSDLEIFKSELKNINKHLIDVLDLERLESILSKVEKKIRSLKRN